MKNKLTLVVDNTCEKPQEKKEPTKKVKTEQEFLNEILNEILVIEQLLGLGKTVQSFNLAVKLKEMLRERRKEL